MPEWHRQPPRGVLGSPFIRLIGLQHAAIRLLARSNLPSGNGAGAHSPSACSFVVYSFVVYMLSLRMHPRPIAPTLSTRHKHAQWACLRTHLTPFTPMCLPHVPFGHPPFRPCPRLPSLTCTPTDLRTNSGVDPRKSWGGGGWIK